jgi:alpha-1,2-mannosyltransferase
VRQPPALSAATALALVVYVVAVALRTYPWTKPNVLLGMMEYDDGVYYAAANAVVHGQIPYREFVLLHPPGSIIALLPFVTLGSIVGDNWGLAIARVAVVAVSLVNLYLSMRLAGMGIERIKAQRAAMLLSGLVYATYTNAVQAEHTLLLEPIVNLLCLMSITALVRCKHRYSSVALASFGLAMGTTVKVFAVAYILAALLWLAYRRQGRLAVTAAVSYLLTLILVMAPWMLMAGAGAVWSDLVSTQLRRPPDGDMSTLQRMSDIFGLTSFLGHPAAGLTVAAISIGVVAVGAVMFRRDSQSQLWWFLTVTAVAAFLLSSAYFSHYSDFLAPAFAILLGRSAAIGGTLVPARLRRPAWPVGACLLVIFLGGGAVRPLSDWSGEGNVAAAVRQFVPEDACMFTDSVSLTVAANRLRVSSPSCRQWIDGRGYALTLTKRPSRAKTFYPVGFRQSVQWQRETMVQLQQAQFLLVRGDPLSLPEWSDSVRAYAATNFELRRKWVGDWPWQLWARRQ